MSYMIQFTPVGSKGITQNLYSHLICKLWNPQVLLKEFSHITPLSPEAGLVDEIDERSAESSQVRVENVPEVVNSSFTERRETQNCDSDGGALKRRGGNVSSSLATVLADHTPQVGVSLKPDC